MEGYITNEYYKIKIFGYEMEWINVTRDEVELTVANTDTSQEIHFVIQLGKILIQLMNIRETLVKAFKTVKNTNVIRRFLQNERDVSND